MPRQNVERLNERFKKAWSKKQRWNDYLEDAYDYAMPNRNVLDGGARGEDKMDRVFDSTAIESTQNFASTLQNKLTPPFEEWFDLTAGPLIPEDDQGKVNKRLNKISQLVQQVFNTGSFNQATHEFYLDLATGTSAMLVQEGDSMDRPVKFQAVNQSTVAFEEGANNEIDSVYREINKKVRLIKQEWEDAELPKRLKEKKDQDPDKKVKLREITYKAKREDAAGPNDLVWYYDVIWEGGEDNDESTRIVERTMEDSPWIIARWSVLPGENQGRGPLMFALPDIKTLNKAVEMTLKNASLALASPYTVSDDGVTNPDNVEITPGALIPVGRNGGPNGPSIQPLETSRNFDIGQLVIEDLRMQIKKNLFDDSLPPQDLGTPRSATEISQRIAELQKQIGGSFGRLFKEFLVPLIQKVINILHKKRMIQLPVKVDTLGVRIQVTSPLARGQNLDDIQNVTRWLDTVSQLAGPQAAQMAGKMDNITSWLAKKLGVPDQLIRSEEEAAQLLSRLREASLQARESAESIQGEVEASKEAGGVEQPNQRT